MSAVTSSTTTTTTSTTAPSTSSTTASSTTSSTTSSSTSSSTSTASAYTAAASASVSALAHHGAESVKSLGNRPTSMKCSGCAADLGIPPTVWEWRCTQSHLNHYGAAQCSTCHEHRGPSVSWPAMLCERCGTVTTVPGSEAESALKGSFATLRSSLHGFIDPPKLFHCENCNTSLVVPQGPWTCQACTQVNTDAVTKCLKCGQLKGAQRVLCGHCHKATSIPESGLVDVLKSGLSSFSRFANKGWLDLTGQANVDCPSCHQPVKLPTHVTPPSAATHTAPAVGTVAPGAAPTAEVAPSALPPAPQGVPASEWQMPVVCQACHHQFSVGRGVAVNGAQQWRGADGLADPGKVAGGPGGRGVDMQVALEAPADMQGTSATATH